MYTAETARRSFTAACGHQVEAGRKYVAGQQRDESYCRPCGVAVMDETLRAYGEELATLTSGLAKACA